MDDFDVIVIGGGPSGCYAGLISAVNGLRVAIFEEHNSIGWPRHDPGWLMESEFTESLIRVTGKIIPWVKVKEYRVYDPETRELLEKSTLGGYLVRRDILEKEIAASAIRAGAKLYLRTKVMKLIRKEGWVVGVETNSQEIPIAKAKLFICADGIRSAVNGLAVQEGLCEKGEIRTGISYLLANADVSEGIIEHFLSSDPLLNYRCFFSHGDGICFFGSPTEKAFFELKVREDNMISQKIKKAFALEVNGFARASSGKYAKYFEKIVRDNLLFIGDASGGAGNIHGMIQGQFAGKVAVSAIQEKDISEERLSEYQTLVSNTLGKAPFYWFSAREDFGSFNDWFHQFEKMTRGIKALELEPSTPTFKLA